jgi:hypothetical protein
MKYNFRWIAILIFISSCANKVSPTGGAKDEVPPQLLNSIPENNSVNFNAPEITLNFDEYVQLNDASSQILISPIPAKAPTIKAYKKSIVITFDSLLQSNTTYAINFGKAIADVHEGNVNDTIRYVFSTGSSIDSLFIKGIVKEAETLKPCAKYSLLLYEIVDRSNLEEVLKEKPTYFGKTDEKGFFKINNLKKGSYYIAAVDDKNNNYLADSDESVGFISGVIDLPINDDINIFSFKQVAKDLKLLKNTLLDRTTALVVYNLPAQLNCSNIGNKYSDKDFYYLPTTNGDSLFISLKDLSINEVQFLITDGNNVNDTLQIDFSEKKSNTLNFEWKNIQTTSDTLRLNSNHPLEKMQVPALLFKDTILIDSIYFSEEAPNKLRLNNYPFTRGVRYQLMLPKGTVQDIYGNKNDSMQIYISLLDREHSGNIIAHLEYKVNSNPYLIQLLNNDYNVVIQQRLLKGQKINEFHFDYVTPGKYFIRVVDDEDNNQELSQGILNKKQPEKVWITDSFTVRANWDLDVQLKLIKENDRQLNEPN